MLVILTALLALIDLLSVTVRADHSTCGWTGPGAGDPTQYNFTLWCWANKIIIVPVDPGPPAHDHAIYLCGDEHKRQKVADWNILGGTGSQLLEIATPCNHGGYALKGHTCPYDYWSICLSNSSDPRAISQCLFLTSFNDCQWPGTFDIATLPVYIAIFAK